LAARDLSALQAGLARALARARAGEDRELHQKLRDRGDALAQVLAALFRTTRMHAADNRAFDAPIAELVRVLAEVVELLGTVQLVAVEDQVYLNDVRVRSEVKGADLGAELARHNAGGLTFHAALDEAQVRALVAAFARKPAPEAPRRALQAALDAAGVGCVEATPRYRFRTRSTPEQDGRDPVEVVRRTLRLVDDTFEHVSLGRVLNPLPLRRSVAEVMAVGAGAPELWETLASGTPLANHAATVMLTSLLVGRAAGFSRAALQDLGVAALLHDVGYAAVPPEEVATPRALAGVAPEAERDRKSVV